MIPDPIYEPAQIEVPFPVLLRGKDTTGDRFELHSVLDSFSNHDLSLRIDRPLAVDSQLLACVSLSVGQDRRHRAVAMLGRVRCTTHLGGGYWRVSIAYDRHRFVSLCAD
jgi:hypothetical protein